MESISFENLETIRPKDVLSKNSIGATSNLTRSLLKILFEI